MNLRLSLIYLLLTNTFYIVLSAAEPWNESSSKLEIREDDYQGKHLYITFTDGPVTMMRAALPNSWKIKDAKLHAQKIILKVESMNDLCYDQKSFSRVYSEVMSLEKEEDVKKASVWQKHSVTCE